MTEDEEYSALKAEVDELRRVTTGGFNPSKLARMQAESVMLLYRSSLRLARSSERLTKMNLWLTVAVFIVALLRLGMVIFQIWLTVASLETLPVH